MLTAANLSTAARNAAATAGVSGVARSDWTLEQRATYNRELIRQIIAYPASFAPEVLQQALASNTDYGYRGNTFDSALDIVGDAVAPVAGGLQSIGQGAIATANLARWLLPVAAVLIVGLWILKNFGPPRGGSAARVRS